jgi:hypothetical protein
MANNSPFIPRRLFLALDSLCMNQLCSTRNYDYNNNSFIMSMDLSIMRGFNYTSSLIPLGEIYVCFSPTQQCDDFVSNHGVRFIVWSCNHDALSGMEDVSVVESLRGPILRARLVDGNVGTIFDPGNDRLSTSRTIDDGRSADDSEAET